MRSRPPEITADARRCCANYRCGRICQPRSRGSALYGFIVAWYTVWLVSSRYGIGLALPLNRRANLLRRIPVHGVHEPAPSGISKSSPLNSRLPAISRLRGLFCPYEYFACSTGIIIATRRTDEIRELLYVPILAPNPTCDAYTGFGSRLRLGG